MCTTLSRLTWRIHIITLWVQHTSSLSYTKLWELARLLEHSLFIIFFLIQFLPYPKVGYLGHFISKGVSMDSQKMLSILEWPMPKTPKALRGFLGLMGYYRRLICNSANIPCPLTDLLKKQNFKWNGDRNKTFIQIFWKQ